MRSLESESRVVPLQLPVLDLLCLLLGALEVVVEAAGIVIVVIVRGVVVTQTVQLMFLLKHIL